MASGLRWLIQAGFLTLLLSSFAFPALADATASAAAMKARLAALQPELQNTPFHRPLHIDSVERQSSLQGDIYALLDYPFAQVNLALNDPSGQPVRWCDLLMLHLNVKYCKGDDAAGLQMFIGKKVDQPLESAYPMQLRYRVIDSTAEHFAVGLDAEEGPLGTRDYRIVLEAIPAGGRTFMHLSYAYGYSMTSRMLMKSYLATLGRNKVGFSIVGHDSDGEPRYIDGMRAVVERNAIRYYFTVDAFLHSLGAAPNQQREVSLESWFDSCEQYPLQLHEVDRDEYLSMKRHEFARLNARRK